jgi:hypothetical protein
MIKTPPSADGVLWIRRVDASIETMRYSDLGHPLCAHLREGSWALDYAHTFTEIHLYFITKMQLATISLRRVVKNVTRAV